MGLSNTYPAAVRARTNCKRTKHMTVTTSCVNGCRILAGTRWPNMKYVTDAHRALIPTCRHSLKVCSGWRHSSCKIRTISLSLWLPRCLACTANDGCTVRISSAGNLITILSNFGGYKTFRPRLTKYCRECVPGIPGGVDAYGNYSQQLYS